MLYVRKQCCTDEEIHCRLRIACITAITSTDADNFSLTSYFRHHAVNYERWITVSGEDKKCLFARFIADCGGAIKTMTALSSDSQLHITKMQHTAKYDVLQYV